MAKQKDQYTLSGDKLITKVKQIIKEGNARKIIIKNEDGKTLLEFPLTIGAVGVVAAPVVAALGALAALVSKCSIVVERMPVSSTPAQKKSRKK